MSGRRLRSGFWTVPLVAGAVLGVLGLAVAPYGLSPSPQTVFSVKARTGVVEVMPLCSRGLVWDLPRGRVLPRSCDADEPEDCGGEHDTVTVSLLAGSSARIEMRTDGRWTIVFGVNDAAECPGTIDAPIRVATDSADLARDEQGYFFVASSPQAGEAPPAFSLPLAGRVIIGQFVEFGGGWAEVHSPTLTEGRVLGRDAAIGTGERLTLLDEEVDPGSIVDTHLPRPEDEGSAWSADAPAATGFILSNIGEPSSDTSEMLVQLSQQRSVGVIPYDGVGRRLEVPRWKVWWDSPLPQLAASFVGVLAGLFGLFLASRDAYRAHQERCEQAKADTPEANAGRGPAPGPGSGRKQGADAGDEPPGKGVDHDGT